MKLEKELKETITIKRKDYDFLMDFYSALEYARQDFENEEIKEILEPLREDLWNFLDFIDIEEE